MGKEYRLYANNFAGGEVDVSAPYAVTTSLSIAVGPLAFNADAKFLLRVCDTVTSLEEKNTAATTRIILDGSGVDITKRPAPVVFASARALAGGLAEVVFSFARNAFGGKPTGFKLWATAGGVVNYAASPNTTVAYEDHLTQAYRATISGLSNGVTYAIGVRSYNALGLCPAPVTPLSVVGMVTTAPAAVDAIAGFSGFQPNVPITP